MSNESDRAEDAIAIAKLTTGAMAPLLTNGWTADELTSGTIDETSAGGMVGVLLWRKVVALSQPASYGPSSTLICDFHCPSAPHSSTERMPLNQSGDGASM